jgi:penicillin-binding protein 2
MITGMAALQKGLVSPNETINDVMSSLGSQTAQIQGTEEWGNHYFGYVNIYSALANSSNIYFQVIGRRVFENDPEYIGNIAHEFGLGVKTGIDLPDEQIGTVPSPGWKKEYFKPYYDRKHQQALQDIETKYANLEKGASAADIKKYEQSKKSEINQENWQYQQNTTYYVDWRLFDTFYDSIGQGYNSYSPIQMANYVATIVNGGKHYQPYIVDKIINPQTNEVVKQNQPTLLNKVSISQENLEIIKKAMSEVTGPNGTAGFLFLDTPEFTGGGKTGTAQIGSKDSILGESYNGMFVAFAPYEKPQIAFAGVVEYGGHGGETAGKVAKAAFKKYFGWK